MPATATQPSLRETLTGRAEEIGQESERLIRELSQGYTGDRSNPEYEPLRTLNPDERLLLRLGGIDDDPRRLEHEIARVQREDRLRRVSVTSEKLAELEQELASIRDRNSQELPALRKQLKEIEGVIRSATDSEARAEAEIDQIIEARRDLESVLPPHLLQQVEAIRSKVQARFSPKLRGLSETQGELKMLLHWCQEANTDTHVVRVLNSWLDHRQEDGDEMDIHRGPSGINYETLGEELRTWLEAVEGDQEGALDEVHQAMAPARAIVAKFVDEGFSP